MLLADTSLAGRLTEEIKFEEQEAENAGEPEFLRDFLKEGVWEVSR